MGNKGPKLAGRAKKNVELSSVRLMMAEGGNNEAGDVKEKKAFTLPLVAVVEELWTCSSCNPKAT